MFKQIFNPENFFFRGVSKFMDIVGLSLLWLVFCLPVVTAGPASAALYYSAVKCLRRGEERPYGNFLKSFRSNLKTGIFVTLPCLAAGAFLVWELILLFRVAAGGDPAAQRLYMTFLFLLVLPAGFLCWLLPLLSRFEQGPGGLLWSAFQLTLRYLPTTVGLAALGWLFLQVNLRLWFLLPAAYTPALWAVLSSFPLERVLKKLTPQTEEGEETLWYLR